MGKYYEEIEKSKMESDYPGRLYSCYEVIDTIYRDKDVDSEMLKRKARLQQKSRPKGVLGQWLSRMMGKEADDIFEQYCASYEIGKIDEAVEGTVGRIKEHLSGEEAEPGTEAGPETEDQPENG